MNKAAQALGRLARGKPKQFSEEAKAKARIRLAIARTVKAKNQAQRKAQTSAVFTD